ncbi:MAG: hypothetical protein KAS71_03995 [Bacteroidales bacterium]|nr:hypothetical protein [Bacteroidales bacterium]
MRSKIIFIVLLAMGTISFKAPEQKKIIFYGDSITAAGTRDDNAYINKFGFYAKEDNFSPKLINAGISGNKVTDLYLRLEKDVLSQSPDIVVIYIGVNDIWHKTTKGTGTDFNKFGEFYDEIVQKLLAENINVVICTPAVIGEKIDCSNQQDGDLNKYSQWIRDYAELNDLALVDLRELFLTYNRERNIENIAQGILTTDGVHLNTAGNDLVAKEMWGIMQAYF